VQVEEVKKVHILAHNMGNRALIEALQNFQIPDRWSFVQGSTSQSSNRQNIVQVDVKGVLENVIFLAPNAMRARFEDMDFDSICRWRWEQQRHLYFTIYSSAADQKLFLPKRLHEQNQLVDTQSLVHMEKRGKFYSFTRPIEVIDTSGVDINMSPQHSYKYLDCKFLHDDIAKDIQNLLSSHKPAAERHKNILKSRGRSLFLVKHENSPIFYAFNPSRSEKDGNWTLKAESIEQEEIQATAKHSSYQTE
jgi:esterase/lipase superfamily enzyme